MALKLRRAIQTATAILAISILAAANFATAQSAVPPPDSESEFGLWPTAEPSALPADALFPAPHALLVYSDRLDDRFRDLFEESSPNEPRPRPGPNVPEPMVFDLIRPLGARQGEFEINVLGFAPFRRTRSKTPQFSFISGSDQSTQLREGFEWAPEIEYALIDNFAVEFELPMADGHVEAFKGAAQYTLGTAFNDQFIHGFQGILFIDRTNGAVTPTILYVAALRFDPVYSLNLLLGFSHEFGGDNPINPTQIIFAPTLFAEISEQWTLGLEANYLSELDGAASLLFVPQAHWSMTEHFSLQFGVGARAQEGDFTGEAIFRVIQDF